MLGRLTVRKKDILHKLIEMEDKSNESVRMVLEPSINIASLSQTDDHKSLLSFKANGRSCALSSRTPFSDGFLCLANDTMLTYIICGPT